MTNPKLLMVTFCAVLGTWAVGCGDDANCSSTCGDGTMECVEQCDDGNNVDGDGCDATCHLECNDIDGDTFLPIECGGRDCDNTNPSINPGQSEICNNGIDDDCDAATPDIFDADGDGDNCVDDCNDTNNDVGPSLPERCNNGVDDDCDPSTEDVRDADEDGYLCTMDCDDTNPMTRPDTTEICGNDNDDDCNGLVDCEDPSCSSLPSCAEPRGGVSGGTHRGTVDVEAIDALTEAPISGASLTVSAGTWTAQFMSDGQGKASATDVPWGPVTVTMKKAGYVTLSLVAVNAQSIVLPLEPLSPSMATQAVTIPPLDASLAGASGILFTGFGQRRELAIRDDGQGGAAVDADAETPAIDPLRLIAREGAPMVFDLLVEKDDGSFLFGYDFVGAVPSPEERRVPLRDSPVHRISGEVVVQDGSSFSPLTATEVEVGVRTYIGRYGTIEVARPLTLAPDNPQTALFSESTDDGALEVMRLKEAGAYAVVGEVRSLVGLDEVRSLVQIHTAFEELPPSVSLSGFKEPPSLLLFEDGDRAHPAVVWDPQDPPGDGGGVHRIRVLDDQGRLIWKLWLSGGSDGVRLPIGDGLADNETYEIELGAYFVESLDFNDFSFAEIERRTSYAAFRTAAYLLR